MQNHTDHKLERLYADAEIATQFHRLWQAEGWSSDKFLALWGEAEEMVEAARGERVEKLPA